MLAKVYSAAVNGIEAYPVEVEVNAGYGDTVLVIIVNKTPKTEKLVIRGEAIGALCAMVGLVCSLLNFTQSKRNFGLQSLFSCHA